MANEFVVRKGLVSSGSINVSGSITASFFNGDGSQLTSISNSALPGGIVSSSTQVTTLLPSNIVSSSTQVKSLLPDGSVSSSAQYPGWVTASSQIDYNQITNKLSGVVSSSAQVTPLLPAGTVSASSQVDITATTGYTTFSSSLASVDAGQTTRIDNLASLTSSYAINSTIQGQLAGVVSSSAQVKPLLPGGTVTSSAQYPGWVTASSQIDYNSITNKLSGVISSSIQFNELSNTSASYALTASFAANANIPAGTISASSQFKTLSDPFTGSFTGSFRGDGSQLTGIAINPVLSSSLNIDTYTFVGDGITTNYSLSQSYSSNSIIVSVEGLSLTNPVDYTLNTSTLQFVNAPPSQSNILVKAFVNVTQNMTGSFSGSFQGSITSASYAATASYTILPLGLVSSSGQIDYNSITNKLSGVVSASEQVQPLLPAGTVSSSAQTVANITGQLISPAGITSSNHIIPSADNSYNLGSPANRWANLYTGDLVLSNEGSQGNSVDGTTGNWTIQEGEEELFILNNKTGKKYKFMLVEIK